ncbi:rCG54644 [Rattus norvegicus]|uniref:RCG54644 n=1 Tax=Rattus norvegicus TaxID=10116 RepID=A6J959_RAT|nr:rCG54644 [Rattus norvegicus]
MLFPFSLDLPTDRSLCSATLSRPLSQASKCHETRSLHDAEALSRHLAEGASKMTQ